MNCVYCQRKISGKEKSKEHVYPQWVQDFLDAKSVRARLKGGLFGESTTVRTMANNALTHKICATCNNGWLSEIDASCIKTTKKLMIGSHHSINDPELTIDEKRKLGKLIYKITLNFIAASPLKEKYLEEMNEFYQTQNPPDDLAFFLCKICDVAPLSAGFSGQWKIIFNSKESSLGKVPDWSKKNFFKAFFQMGHAAFMVARMTDPDFILVYHEALLRPLISGVPLAKTNLDLNQRDDSTPDEYGVVQLSENLIAAAHKEVTQGIAQGDN